MSRCCSSTASIFSLTKNIVGAGILCLAAGMAAGRGTGFVPAVALVLFSCALSTYSFHLVGRVVDVKRRVQSMLQDCNDVVRLSLRIFR